MARIYKVNAHDEMPDARLCEQCDVRHRAMCAAVEFAQLGALEQIVSHSHYGPRQVIFEEGEPAVYVHNVSCGNVRLYKLLADGRRQITGFLRPGDFLGLAKQDSYAYGAEAIDDVELCSMRIVDLERLMTTMPQVRDRLLEMSRDELTAAQEQMLLLGRKSAREKLLSFLLLLTQQNEGVQEHGSVKLDLRMTRADIGDFLGLSLETVSRIFGELRKDGLIKLPEPQRVIIPDIEKLEDAASVD